MTDCQPPTANCQLLPARFGSRSYSLHYGRDIFGLLPGVLEEKALTGSILVVSNPAIRELQGERLKKALAGREVHWALIPEGEQHKNLQTVADLYVECAKARMDREACIIALGGGVIQDLTDYVAATFKRGIPFIQVPTSLLSQVDIGIGGCAVDHPLGKSLIGTFYQPKAAIQDLMCIETLPDAEYINGISEIINKVVGLGGVFDRLKADMPAIAARDLDKTLEYIMEANRIKIGIIERDEIGLSGERLVLDWGHTITYAIEKVTDYRMPHGTALGIGMHGAAILSRNLGFLAPDLVDALRELIAMAGLPTHLSDEINLVSLLPEMRNDGKAKNGVPRFILLREFGGAFLSEPIPDDEIVKVLSTLRA
ncbi:MAG: 3-dehydroquinate synthase [Candidatus Coatesbacteria bacterium]|nr:3-dehydroquinate synthase [Candidatus Coatesbacteria bacterium]